MPRYEYKVVPAPEHGKRGKGIKGTKGRFAHALEAVMNELGAEGWSYLRTDTLPCEERTGLTGKTTIYQNMLVFQRSIAEADPTEVTSPSPSPAVPLRSAKPSPALAAPPAVTLPPIGKPTVDETGTARDSSASDAAAAAAAALAAYREGRNRHDDDRGLAAE